MARMGLVLVAAVVWVGAWPGAAAAASWSWPVAGVVHRPFAPPEHRWGVGHRGVDLLTAPGAPVRAAGAGRVSYAGLLAGRGVVVVVHGALRTTYEPVTATVGLGEVVAGGEVIGVVEAGHLGCPVLACLHWGLRRGEDYLDPLRLVEPGPVRLLPVSGGGPPTASGSGLDAPVSDGEGAAAGPPAVVLTRARTVDAAVRPSSGGGRGGDTAALAALGAGTVLAGAALRRRS